MEDKESEAELDSQKFFSREWITQTQKIIYDLY
jgi:hypothetical protein